MKRWTGGNVVRRPRRVGVGAMAALCLVAGSSATVTAAAVHPPPHPRTRSAMFPFPSSAPERSRDHNALERFVLSVANPRNGNLAYLSPADLEARFGREIASATRVTAPGVSNDAPPGPDLQPPTIGPSLPPQTGTPFRPDDIARIYGFDRLYAAGISGTDDRRSTIAIATAGDLDREAVQQFWAAVGIQRSMDTIEVIPVTGSLSATNTETTLDVEWASSMASGARILVYAAADASAASFIQVYDRIVQDNRAAVLTTSWGLCELGIPSPMRDQAHAIFEQAAAQGITVIAASGDNGAFDCGQSSPGVSFPASDPFVLAVGGTTLHDDGGTLTESAWQDSGGGPSSAWPAPPWQMTAVAGRGMVDVAFDADPGSGFLAYIDGGWWNFGGTSMAAPCWAALVALINQRRAAAGRDTLGLAAPALCEIASSPAMGSFALRDVVTGRNSAFPATPGWDFPTGWGTPQAGNLADTLATWSPPADSSGAATESFVLAPMDGATGMVSARFAHRCLTTFLQLSARGLTPGRYDVDMDGETIASFNVGAGIAVIELDNVDPRGHVLEVRDDRHTLIYSGTPPASPQPAVQLRVPLLGTGQLSAASGTVAYRQVSGREQYAVAIQGVPAGDYIVRVGAEVVGTVTVTRGQPRAGIRFDSTGTMGHRVDVSPLCTVVAVVRDDAVILRTPSDAFLLDSCPASSP